ncbi:Cell fate regulator YaaT, PSP1 superfamily (controls sporulation, competence, biofilm development) [Zhouia amylolytica]|uniref:Cell fate regulator YaaT, PSP1 superfamily (Controls sporulation, competence, biofilm development) n=2 Tax=Zhouia amylolytica TaxID=376730 RepID=A0A1I6PLZ7_9FLAO|nr:regulatory iron-sulfur-containing complex subunit RicT [Zhouia amylolytica]ETN94139.1 putative PSP1-like protein [Zhouia amylolytica AD3]SFS41221.1 Cell fate regulator YaaT, PSP1 superfamily (controls sporulation, competence, biofilm development) [Zhouia amylolytica]
MGCSSCATGKDGLPRGCKNNGTCGTDGCNKLTVFDWLSNMALPAGEERFDCVEVRFKNSRKEYFRNPDNLTLSIGDVVATEAAPGHDVGIVTLTGELVKVQMKKRKVDWNEETLPKVYRKASQKDINIWHDSRDKEPAVQKKSRELALALGLQMKLSDVEFQGDGSKATFYYTAEERVDFRQLIKDMAREFGIRIEMRQIGYRQEAARLGGIGSCGRELCCSTWLTDFRSVNTASARYQQLSLNPQKLAGQCGKLKCCLNYELDAYLDALKEFPEQDVKLKTQKGLAACQKIDIFKGLMWFCYLDEPSAWHKLTVQQVNEIIDLSKKRKPVASLEEYAAELLEDDQKDATYENVVGQDSLTRFDKPKKGRGKKRKKRPRNNNRKKSKNG